MSGGHFNGSECHIDSIVHEIEELIETNDDEHEDAFGCPMGRHYPEEIIAKFKEAVIVLRKAHKMATRIDWLVSGNDGEESFLKRWEEEGL